MEGDKEDLQRKTEFPDEEKLCMWCEVDMDLDSSSDIAADRYIGSKNSHERAKTDSYRKG